MDPRQFGRGRPRVLDQTQEASPWTVSDDLKLFVTTFAAGFLFVSILIA